MGAMSILCFVFPKSVLSSRCLFIICGDSNITSEAMESPHGSRRLAVQRGAPTQPTCTAGQASSIIDYAILSTGMARSNKGISVARGPSAPHLAVFCQVNIDLASMTTQVIVVPRALPPVAEDPPPSIAWNDIAPVHSLNDEDSITKVLGPWRVRIAADASDLARDLSLWFAKADVHRAQQAQVSDQGRYIGWGRPALSS